MKINELNERQRGLLKRLLVSIVSGCKVANISDIDYLKIGDGVFLFDENDREDLKALVELVK